MEDYNNLNLSALVDVHVHSTFSHDGEDEPEILYKHAEKLGLGGICFTEHGDYKPQLEHAGYFSYEHFNSTLHKLKKSRNDKRPLLLQGLEFSEPHIYPQDFSRINQLDLDMITGAVHWVEGIFVGEDKILNKLSKRELFDRYYDKIIAMVEFGGFDVLSHLQFPARYHGSAPHLQGKLEKILKMIIEKNIVLEVNTAVTEKPASGSYLPEEKVLQMYKNLGGEKVVLGSDAHSRQEVAQSFLQAKRMTKELGLIPGYFSSRSFKQLSKLEEE